MKIKLSKTIFNTTFLDNMYGDILKNIKTALMPKIDQYVELHFDKIVNIVESHNTDEAKIMSKEFIETFMSLDYLNKTLNRIKYIHVFQLVAAPNRLSRAYSALLVDFYEDLDNMLYILFLEAIQLKMTDYNKTKSESIMNDSTWSNAIDE